MYGILVMWAPNLGHLEHLIWDMQTSGWVGYFMVISDHRDDFTGLTRQTSICSMVSTGC